MEYIDSTETLKHSTYQEPWLLYIYHNDVLICKTRPMVQSQEPAETRSRPNFPESRIVFLRHKSPSKLNTSLRKQSSPLALRRWERFARRNVCVSAAEIPY